MATNFMATGKKSLKVLLYKREPIKHTHTHTNKEKAFKQFVLKGKKSGSSHGPWLKPW